MTTYDMSCTHEDCSGEVQTCCWQCNRCGAYYGPVYEESWFEWAMRGLNFVALAGLCAWGLICIAHSLQGAFA